MSSQQLRGRGWIYTRATNTLYLARPRRPVDPSARNLHLVARDGRTLKAPPVGRSIFEGGE